MAPSTADVSETTTSVNVQLNSLVSAGEKISSIQPTSNPIVLVSRFKHTYRTIQWERPLVLPGPTAQIARGQSVGRDRFLQKRRPRRRWHEFPIPVALIDGVDHLHVFFNHWQVQFEIPRRGTGCGNRGFSRGAESGGITTGNSATSGNAVIAIVTATVVTSGRWIIFSVGQLGQCEHRSSRTGFRRWNGKDKNNKVSTNYFVR